jgi:hypothetical protein
LRRATAKRERPPPAIGIEAKPFSKFRAEEGLTAHPLTGRSGPNGYPGFDEQMFGAE